MPILGRCLVTPDHKSLQLDDADAFRAAVAPICDLVGSLAETGLMSGSRAGGNAPFISHESRAMADLEKQKRLAGEWDPAPIDTCRTQIFMAMHAAEDAMLSFAGLFSGDHLPIWSYHAVARFGIESLANVFWLSEPPIETEERVRRSLNERLRSEHEASYFAERTGRPSSRQRLLAASAVLACKPTKPGRGAPHLGKPPPTVTKRIQHLLGDQLGKSFYSYSSAIAHAMDWGLMQVVATNAESTGPVVPATLVNSSSSVGMAGVGLATAYLTASQRVRIYLGIQDTQWSKQSAAAHQTIRAMLDSWNGETVQP